MVDHKAQSGLTGTRACVRLCAMKDARQRVIRKILSLPEDKQQRLHDAMGDLLTKLKAEWEARPENGGKTATYTELWDDYVKKVKVGGPP